MKPIRLLLSLAGLLLGSSVVAQDTNRLVFVCFGQSNMEGFPGIEEQDKGPVDERFQVLAAVDFPKHGRTKGNWYPAVPPLCRPSAGLSPADYFGRTLVSNLPPNIKVGIVNVSVAGCKIELFNKDNFRTYVSTAPKWMTNIINTYSGNPYEHLVNMAKLAQKDGVIKGILLHQGESNTNDKEWPQKVKAIYENLLSDLNLRAEDVPLLVGELVNEGQEGACASMNKIIDELPTTIPTAHVVSSEGCVGRPDHLHFTPAGYRELGRRYGQEMLSLLGRPTAAAKQRFEGEDAKLIGGASKVADGAASGGFLVSLSTPGQGTRFAGLPAAGKLAIRYASVQAGTISVAVNDQAARKVNVHSSGALTRSFLNAIIELPIPANATLAISLATNDVAVNIDQIMLGDGDLGLPPDIWNLPPLPVAPGPYSPDWEAISRLYIVPEWWRDAKFGAWAHWDPQSMPEQGDWYARGMYMEGNAQYKYHLIHFGHPSEYGYKDICNNWVIDRWRPDELMDLFVEMGARYFMAMGVHHDNFDCWDSAYQPWNSVRVGPKMDVVGAWEKAARQHGLRFGIGFHHSPARTWGQFMTVRYTTDKRGAKQGVPYDALQTILEGKGKWWEGMDPVDLYGSIHTSKDPLLSPFANQFMWRVDDAITKYHPDVIYFDEHAGDSQVDLGVHMGLGFLAPPLIANYYNKSLKWNQGEMDVVINLKGVGGRYNSFQNSPGLLPLVDRSLVKSTEAIIESQIMAYSFQTETSIADWHYRAGQRYMDARGVICSLLQNVSRNGSLLLNITQHGRGDLDPQLIQICKDTGAWLKVNGEAVYASRPFEVFGDNTVCYTRNQGNVYATLLDWTNGPVTLKALPVGGATLGKVSKVELLGSDVALTFVQDRQGLTVTPAAVPPPLPGITNQLLASRCRVLRISHDKGWFNDDDPGVAATGWVRRCNLGTGDFNNDLTTSDRPGTVWNCSLAGTSVKVIAPKETGAGKVEVQIDGQTHATVDLSTTGMRQAQQVVWEVAGLTPGKHALNIINRGQGPVAVDAIIVR